MGMDNNTALSGGGAARRNPMAQQQRRQANQAARQQRQQQRQAQKSDRQQQRAVNKQKPLQGINGGGATNPTPAAPTPGPGPASYPGAPSGGTTVTAPPSLSDQLNPYTTPLPPIVKAYMDKLMGGQINAPDFQTMFSQYSDVANREANRQAAAINESMGATGGLSSSATLGAQSRLRENVTSDLALQASQYQQQLEQQQFNEISGVSQLAWGSGEAGMNRYWQDFLRRTSVPPFMEGALGLSESYGLPATVL